MMREILLVAAVAWSAVFISGLRGEFCEIEKTIREIEAKTERMQADPGPKYVDAQQ